MTLTSLPSYEFPLDPLHETCMVHHQTHTQTPLLPVHALLQTQCNVTWSMRCRPPRHTQWLSVDPEEGPRQLKHDGHFQNIFKYRTAQSRPGSCPKSRQPPKGTNVQYQWLVWLYVIVLSFQVSRQDQPRARHQMLCQTGSEQVDKEGGAEAGDGHKSPSQLFHPFLVGFWMEDFKLNSMPFRGHFPSSKMCACTVCTHCRVGWSATGQLHIHQDPPHSILIGGSPLSSWLDEKPKVKLFVFTSERKFSLWSAHLI